MATSYPKGFRETIKSDPITRVDSNTGPSVENSQWDQVLDVDKAYLRASKTAQLWHSVLFQMILFGA